MSYKIIGSTLLLCHVCSKAWTLDCLEDDSGSGKWAYKRNPHDIKRTQPPCEHFDPCSSDFSYSVDQKLTLVPVDGYWRHVIQTLGRNS